MNRKSMWLSLLLIVGAILWLITIEYINYWRNSLIDKKPSWHTQMVIKKEFCISPDSVKTNYIDSVEIH